MAPPLPLAAGGRCPFEHPCLCSWRKRCPARIPSVAPGYDYACLPAAGDDRSAWSLVVGFIACMGSDVVLRLHRFRVAQSGRVLGHSNDTLEVLDDVDYKAQEEDTYTQFSCATSMPGSDEGDHPSLCLFTTKRGSVDDCDPDYTTLFSPLQLHLYLNAAEKKRSSVNVSATLPDLSLGPDMRFRPISAAGHLWAACFSDHRDQPYLVMRRLDETAGKWEDVATINLQIKIEQQGADRFFQGYAVLRDKTILLSLQQRDMFVVFDCSSSSLTEVVTTEETRDNRYIPICERGLYLEKDDAVYFHDDSTLYAYKLCQDKGKYEMAPPIMLGRIYPHAEGGCGFVTLLGSQIMCYVWIGVSIRCSCDAKHVLITTFEVEGNNKSSHENFVPQGIKILHSTCRRLNISPHRPNSSYCEFCFLQEYADIGPGNLMMLEGMEVATNSNVVESSRMLSCCRKFLNGTPLPNPLMLEGSTSNVEKSLYIICQTASHSTLYRVYIIDGRLICPNQTLTPLITLDTSVSGDDYSMMEKPFPWHFICGSSHIYAVPCTRTELYLYKWCDGRLRCDSLQKPSKDSINLVVRVGLQIIAISSTFQCVYRLTYGFGWDRINTNRSFEIESKVHLSGYVVLSDSVILVSDADTSDWYSLDMRKRRWSLLPTSWSKVGILSGRSIFVDGFIYTCTNGGLVAVEVVERDGVYCPGRQSNLKFSWRKYWESYKMCLDYVGKDNSGANIFCVVQGGDYISRPGIGNPVCITTVQVKPKVQSIKWKQVITHVDFGTYFVEQKGVIWTSNCFALTLDF